MLDSPEVVYSLCDQIKYCSEHIFRKGEIRRACKKIGKIRARRRKMEQKSYERTKPKNEKIRFSSNIPKIEKAFLPGDLNGCTLVVPEGFATHEQITVYQGRLHKYQL
jgi:hypothetical protein